MQPLLLWKSRKYYIFWVCICSLSYPACKVHVPYYFVTCGLSGCTIFFFTLSHQWHNFRKKDTCVCSLQLLSQIVLNVRRTEWDIINVHRYPCKVPHHSHHILIKLEFSSFSKNTQNVKSHENPSTGSSAVPRRQTDGHTDRHEEPDSHFSKFCESLKTKSFNNVKSFDCVHSPSRKYECPSRFQTT